MNEIRKNKETEVEILQAKFAMPKAMKILYLIYILIFFVIALIMFTGAFFVKWKGLGYDEGRVGSVAITAFPAVFPSCVLAVALYIIYRFHKKAIKQSKCVVTNKAIKGVTVSVFSKKNYHYRLDEIENIEVTSFWGISGLDVHFSQGNMNANASVVYGAGQRGMIGTNSLQVLYLVNTQEVYEKLSDLLESVKNDKDVAIDIEMRKIETEERKAKAFETLASGVERKEIPTSTDDIDKLEKLACMKERGLISESEYERKKVELLNRI